MTRSDRSKSTLSPTAESCETPRLMPQDIPTIRDKVGSTAGWLLDRPRSVPSPRPIPNSARSATISSQARAKRRNDARSQSRRPPFFLARWRRESPPIITSDYDHRVLEAEPPRAAPALWNLPDRTSIRPANRYATFPSCHNNRPQCYVFPHDSRRNGGVPKRR